jgi:hypothetical protein
MIRRAHRPTVGNSQRKNWIENATVIQRLGADAAV